MGHQYVAKGDRMVRNKKNLSKIPKNLSKNIGDLKLIEVLTSPEDYSLIMTLLSSKSLSESSLRRLGCIVAQSWRAYC